MNYLLRRMAGDLESIWAIYLKGFLFFFIMLISGVWLLFEPNVWKRAIFVCALSWSSARLYYFMFYVIEKYVDPSFKFSGVSSFVRYLSQRRS